MQHLGAGTLYVDSGAEAARSSIASIENGPFDIEGSYDENVPPTFARAGGVPERPKGPDCKSDGSAFVGSNPTPSTN